MSKSRAGIPKKACLRGGVKSLRGGNKCSLVLVDGLIPKVGLPHWDESVNVNKTIHTQTRPSPPSRHGLSDWTLSIEGLRVCGVNGMVHSDTDLPGSIGDGRDGGRGVRWAFVSTKGRPFRYPSKSTPPVDSKLGNGRIFCPSLASFSNKSSSKTLRAKKELAGREGLNEMTTEISINCKEELSLKGQNSLPLFCLSIHKNELSGATTVSKIGNVRMRDQTSSWPICPDSGGDIQTSTFKICPDPGSDLPPDYHRSSRRPTLIDTFLTDPPEGSILMDNGTVAPWCRRFVNNDGKITWTFSVPH
ncbi:hypothetical protein B0H11DRAFT_1907945 [Mycena galericulata]|nr:hypothetical protein B0H11DRAFT_1907945 [Mycena galericulata]